MSRPMSRQLPMPWTSLGVFVGWLLLMGEISLLALLGGLLFAWLLPRLAKPFAPQARSAQKPGLILLLAWHVLVDIVKSNIIVAKLVLGDISKLNPAFITVPVDTDHSYVISLVASIITMTPGTLSARVHETPDESGSSIVVHVLNCEDEQALIDEIKTRYEQPLLEIFQCSPSR
ncbi:MAG: Na+/H+ antiporter subunit E [Burkholderiaceae bacterium]